MSMGKGVVYGTSTRQKLNTRSSTEAELVGANDVMSQLLWTQYFLQAQGYLSTETVLYQDNQAAMLLEKNGRASSSKRTRHLNIRYYFITDRIAQKELTVEYCPTKEMLADYFTKPLTGALFTKLRDQVMNIDPSHTEASDRRSVLGMHAGHDDESGNEDSNDSARWNLVTRRMRRPSQQTERMDPSAHLDPSASKRKMDAERSFIALHSSD
jgi:hypothetical protein